MRFNFLKARAGSRRQFTFYHWVPKNSWYSFCQPRKDERLSQPWSYPVVLNTGPLDWETSALTTRLLLHIYMLLWDIYCFFETWSLCVMDHLWPLIYIFLIFSWIFFAKTKWNSLRKIFLKDTNIPW